jgi:hypothetical protein
LKVKKEQTKETEQRERKKDTEDREEEIKCGQIGSKK